MSREAERDLVVRRLIPASPETVFRIWTEPDQLMKWWGPKGVTCPEAKIDLRVGGNYRIANQLPDGRVVWIHGVFESVEPPRLLIYTWGFGLDNVPQERVTVTFERIDGGTQVVVLHENAPESAREGHEHGWIGCLKGLEEFAMGL